MFPGVKGRKQKRDLKNIVSNSAAYTIRDEVLENPDLLGTKQILWFLAKDDIDVFMKGKIDRNLPEDERRIKDYQFEWIDKLIEEDRLEKRFNTVLFSNGDSREPEQAGLKGAIMGSLFTMLVTLYCHFRLLLPQLLIWKSLHHRIISGLISSKLISITWRLYLRLSLVYWVWLSILIILVYRVPRH